MQLLAVFGVVSASAYNVGEHIYSNTAKYKVESANLVQNGTFANGLTGWTNENAGPVATISTCVMFGMTCLVSMPFHSM